MFPQLFPEAREALPGQCRGLAPRSGPAPGAPLRPLALRARGTRRARRNPRTLRGSAAAPPAQARPRRGCARLPAGRSRCGRGAAGMSEAEGGSAAAAVEKPSLPAAGPGAAAAVAAAVAAAAAAAAGPEPGAPAEEAAVVWSPEVEVCLFHAMLGHKPVGERGPRPPGAAGDGAASEAGSGGGSREAPAAPEADLRPGRGRGAAAGPVGGKGGSGGPGRAAL